MLRQKGPGSALVQEVGGHSYALLRLRYVYTNGYTFRGQSRDINKIQYLISQICISVCEGRGCSRLLQFAGARARAGRGWPGLAGARRPLAAAGLQSGLGARLTLLGGA
jgi:hypothetical protein